MNETSNPSAALREVLRVITTRRLPPTPDNFRKIYHEVTGLPEPEESTDHLAFLQKIYRQLSTLHDEPNRQLRQFKTHLDAEAGNDAEAALLSYLQHSVGQTKLAWNTLIANLIRQWDNRHQEWTTARKRESLERVLTVSDPQTLYSRLNGLIKAWNNAPTDPDAERPTSPPSSATLTTTAPPHASDADAELFAQNGVPDNDNDVRLLAPGESSEWIAQLREVLLVIFEVVIPSCTGSDKVLNDECQRLSQLVRNSDQLADFQKLPKQLRNLAYRIESSVAENGEIQAGIVNLLKLLLENIEEIVVDDRWLKGQIETLRDVISSPTNLRLLDDAQRRLKELIYKQSQLKHNMAQSQQLLRNLLAGFVDQLSSFSENTSVYHEQVAHSAQRIAQADSIDEIGSVLDELMQATSKMQQDTQRSRDELNHARQQAEQAEERIQQLEKELDEASRQMRHDQLTGTLNRRGLEEIFLKESSRSERQASALCVALIDIDNFKRLNDTHGHHAGDQALVHLSQVIRSNLRPSDTLARLGGEEFIILYPDSSLDQAKAALERLQWAMTKALFLTDDKKIVITFSAGVSPWEKGESMESVIKRADQAMYQAKTTGKNKVVALPFLQR